MLNFLVSWAEQLIIALMIIVMIEMIIPNSSYRKYIKIVLGIFIMYIIFSPFIKQNIKNFDIEKTISNQIKSNNISTSSKNTIDYNKQIENTYKEKFKQNLTNELNEKGYKVKNIEVDIKYENENIITNKLKLHISKSKQTQNITIEKVKILEEKEEISQQEIEEIKEEISNTYNIEISKILIESENSNG